MTYTLPGGSLARDGQYVDIVCFGTTAGYVAAINGIQFRIGSTVISEYDSFLATGKFGFMAKIIRTGAATQKCFFRWLVNSDGAGATNMSNYVTSTEALSGALAIDINIALYAGGTITQETMIVELSG